MRRLALVALAASLPVIALGCGQASKRTAFQPDPVFSVGSISTTTDHQSLKLDRVASALAGRHAIVDCWSDHDWMHFEAWAAEHQMFDDNGVTFRLRGRIQLSPFVCEVLDQAMAGTVRQPLFTAEAITLLAHESAHASGISVESRAECRGIAIEPRAAQLLGIPKPLATKLQHIYRGTVYPYDLPRYRTPTCSAGLPGIVVPDTLGRSTRWRPLRATAAAVDSLFPAWENVGGVYSVFPLSPCDPIQSRAEELARFSNTILGPRGAQVAYSGVILGTSHDFSTALIRYRTLPRCDVRLRRHSFRMFRSSDTVVLGQAPGSVTRLSPSVHAFREVVTSRGEQWTQDFIYSFDSANRSVTLLFFLSPANEVSAPLEVEATKAALRASR